MSQGARKVRRTGMKMAALTVLAMVAVPNGFANPIITTTVTFRISDLMNVINTATMSSTYDQGCESTSSPRMHVCAVFDVGFAPNLTSYQLSNPTEPQPVDPSDAWQMQVLSKTQETVFSALSGREHASFLGEIPLVVAFFSQNTNVSAAKGLYDIGFGGQPATALLLASSSFGINVSSDDPRLAAGNYTWAVDFWAVPVSPDGSQLGSGKQIEGSFTYPAAVPEPATFVPAGLALAAVLLLCAKYRRGGAPSADNRPAV